MPIWQGLIIKNRATPLGATRVASLWGAKLTSPVGISIACEALNHPRIVPTGPHVNCAFPGEGLCNSHEGLFDRFLGKSYQRSKPILVGFTLRRSPNEQVRKGNKKLSQGSKSMAGSSCYSCNNLVLRGEDNNNLGLRLHAVRVCQILIVVGEVLPAL